MNTHRRTHGFTLIEVLVASAITALIGIIAYGFLGSALDAQTSQQRQADRLNELNLFFVVLARDVRQAVKRPIRTEFGEETEPAVFGGPGTEYLLSLTRGGWYNPRGVVRSSLQRVAYGLNDKQEIERVAWQMLDRASDQNIYKSVVLTGVEEVYFRFVEQNQLRVDDDEIAKEWSESWPPESVQLQQGQPYEELPVAIEITLTLQDLGEIRRIYALAVEKKVALL